MPPARSSTRFARFRAALAAVAIGVAALAALELGLRAAGFEREPARAFDLHGIAREHAPQYLTHPTRLWSLAPGFRENPEHAGRYALGDWPFRGRPGAPAPPDLARVGVVGDSCVYGACLHTAETLSERLALELAGAGWGPERVLVQNLGVPGYSVVQMRALLAELAAAGQRWDALIVAPAVFNDQAPARRWTDVEWREARSTLAGRLARTAVAELVRRALDLEPPFTVEPLGPRTDAGTKSRVPEELLASELDLLFAECRALATQVVAVVGAHPAATAAVYPRLARDAQAVREAARRARVEAVESSELFRAAALADGEIFADYVHPAPRAVELVARALAPLLAAELPRRGGPAPAPFWIESVEPSFASALGDAAFEVRLGGWGEITGVPVVLVGGAPLLDLEPCGAGRFSGVLQSNAPGRHSVVVQHQRGVASRPAAIELVGPTLEGERGPPAALVFRARPGDRARVAYSSRKAARPQCSALGASWIDVATLGVMPALLEAGPDGSARFEVEQALARGVCIQAVVIPRGTAEAQGLGVLTPPLVAH